MLTPPVTESKRLGAQVAASTLEWRGMWAHGEPYSEDVLSIFEAFNMRPTSAMVRDPAGDWMMTCKG